MKRDPTAPRVSDSAARVNGLIAPLLHFWYTSTSLTVSSKSQQHVWQSSLVELSFRHPFLLHGILAVAAVHKAGVFPAESQRLMVQSSSHMDVAISAIRTHIEVPDPAICVPLFAASGLLVVHSLGLAQVHPPADPVANLCDWMRLVQGQKVTVQQNWTRLLASEVAPILLSVGGEQRHAGSEMLRLKGLVEQKVPIDSDVRDPYLQAIEQLDLVFTNIHHLLRSGEMFSVAITLSWTATIPAVVLDLISDRDQLALVILAYFAVLFKLQEASWWMRGWGDWTLDAVQSQLDAEYRQWTDWPTQQMRSK
ncbi:hypothetical protein M409DRAFT_71674 [Zasmidium cellare ATCC 36951]|uniref:Transcription factor domain-containing protein n=1 Tax=Zasmidium cellare ATCC 36951 TaxID=1080233 RepID=A0A6A6BV40_ZASCE|nr:uncharacterized protein M409DRAFT_71674 [Zasmidium cellare ATCC 36951]KAF2158383.1 hypothetical protein M409DRAFT_71674 [Zasmidium cellare ATCC 36951]